MMGKEGWKEYKCPCAAGCGKYRPCGPSAPPHKRRGLCHRLRGEAMRRLLATAMLNGATLQRGNAWAKMQCQAPGTFVPSEKGGRRPCHCSTGA